MKCHSGTEAHLPKDVATVSGNPEKPGNVPTEYRTQPRFLAGRARGGSSRELGGSPGSREPLVLLGYCASRAGVRVSGSLAYPALPHDLGPSPARVSGVFPSRPPSVAEAAERRPSWPLPLLQSARGNAGTALRWFLLSWDWGPCCRCSSRASTPGSRSSRRTGAARCRFMFRPCGFAPLRRFAPRGSCGSVAPRNRPRVHRVSGLPAGGRPKAASGRDPFPRCVSHPPKSSPRQQPDTHHCGRCLPVVLSCPARRTGRNR
jgi:hypothetical protein